MNTELNRIYVNSINATVEAQLFMGNMKHEFNKSALLSQIAVLPSHEDFDGWSEQQHSNDLTRLKEVCAELCRVAICVELTTQLTSGNKNGRESVIEKLNAITDNSILDRRAFSLTKNELLIELVHGTYEMLDVINFLFGYKLDPEELIAMGVIDVWPNIPKESSEY